MKWGSTNVYTEDAAGNPVYSWTLTDGIMDTITGGRRVSVRRDRLHARGALHAPDPVPQLQHHRARRRLLLSARPTTRSGRRSIRAWATHANGRYPDVAASWLWELWNEPDSGYWHGTFDEYAKLYDYTESALHEVLPNAPLGGPAVAGAGGDFLTQFLAALRDRHQRRHRRHRDAPRPRDVPRERRRRRQRGPRRDGPRQPAAASPRRLRRGRGVPAVQADAHLHHRGGSRRLRRLPGERASPARRVPQLARVRRVRDRDDEAHPRARGRRWASSWAACSRGRSRFRARPISPGIAPSPRTASTCPCWARSSCSGAWPGPACP